MSERVELWCFIGESLSSTSGTADSLLVWLFFSTSNTALYKQKKNSSKSWLALAQCGWKQKYILWIVKWRLALTFVKLSRDPSHCLGSVACACQYTRPSVLVAVEYDWSDMLRKLFRNTNILLQTRKKKHFGIQAEVAGTKILFSGNFMFWNAFLCSVSISNHETESLMRVSAQFYLFRISFEKKHRPR